MANTLEQDAQELPQPKPESLAMTPREQAEAKEYGRLELVCDLADSVLDVLVLAVIAFVIARPLDVWLQTFELFQSASLRLGAMFLIATAIHLVVSFPLSFYSGYVLEHRYGLSRLTVRGWLWRYAKRHALGIAFGLLMFLLLYGLIWYAGPWWWVWAAVGFFLVSIVVGQIVPVLILPLFYKIERLGDPRLAEGIARLAEGTGLSIEGVYRIGLGAETSKANAMLAGLGHTRRVLIGDTLLDGFSPEEIEVVFAHEIGHHVHRHIPKMMVLGVLLSAVGFWLCDRIVTAWLEWLEGGPVETWPVYSLPLLMLVLTVLSIVMGPLQNLISRHFERQCDRYALEHTGSREAYVRAFQKLAKINKDDPDPHPAAVILFHSHPPISQRLMMAEE